MAKSVDLGRDSSHDPTALGRKFKQRLRSDDVILGGVIFELIRPPLVKLYRQAGFEFIFADTEHVLLGGRPAMGDFVLAEPKALIGFTGPRVIKETIKTELPEGFQTSEFLLEHGFIDRVVPRSKMRDELANIICYCKD